MFGAAVDLLDVEVEQTIREKLDLLDRELDERARRAWAATEAIALGRGGVAAVHRATGMAVSTIRRGISDLISVEHPGPGRVRRAGGGRSG